MAEKPVYLSPFQTIVGVGWRSGGNFAALQFNADWRHSNGGLGNPNNFSVHVNQLGVSFPIYSSTTAIKRDDGVLMIACKKPFHEHESSTSGGTGMATYKSYTWHMVGPGSLISNGGWNIKVQTVGGETSAFFVGDPPEYGKLPPPYDQTFPSEEAAIAWQVAQAAGFGATMTYNFVAEDGPHVVDGEAHTVIHEKDGAVILFDLAAIRPKIKKGNVLTIDFETGEGPGGGFDDLGNWYTWIAQANTYKSAKWETFAGDVPTWPVPAAGAMAESDVLQGSRDPTPNEHLFFEFDFTTLAIKT